jgi:DNA-binding transcriptional LysR family regulator
MTDYSEEDALDKAIDDTGDVEESIRRYFKTRYIPYLRWLENGSARNRLAYYALRIPAIVLSTLIPPLVAFDLGTTGRAITAGLGVVVASTTAIEHFLASGHRWRHYRGSVELMKSEGWLYLRLAGRYSAYESRATAFQAFVDQVETQMRDEVREYVTTVTAEKGPVPASSPPSTNTN